MGCGLDCCESSPLSTDLDLVEDWFIARPLASGVKRETPSGRTQGKPARWVRRYPGQSVPYRPHQYAWAWPDTDRGGRYRSQQRGQTALAWGCGSGFLPSIRDREASADP